MPYAKAGYAVVAFDIDGTFDERDESGEHPGDVRAVQGRGRRSCQRQNTLEYVLARAARGGSRAAVRRGPQFRRDLGLAVRRAQPHVKGCIAYAPLPDLFGRNPGKRAGLEAGFPGIARLSPQENVELLRCPVFVFHAEDDHTIPIEITRRFVELLKQANSSVTFHTVPTGDHYGSMIKEGIPQGIRWLKSLPAEAKAKPALPVAGHPEAIEPVHEEPTAEGSQMIGRHTGIAGPLWRG